jgi:hypothetical protein
MAKKTRKSKATPQDAELILKLYDLRREAVIRKSRDFMTSQFWPQNYGEFKAVVAAFGTEHNACLRQVWSYWDMACAMVLNGTINEDLFFATNAEPYFLYAKFKPYLEQTRRDMNNPEFMAHIEELVTKSAEGRERVKRLETRIAARFAQIAAAKAGAR